MRSSPRRHSEPKKGTKIVSNLNNNQAMSKKAVLASAFWRFFVASVLCCTAAQPQGQDTSTLGLALGLPMGSRGDAAAPSAKERVPEFVTDMYNCWGSEQKSDCLPHYLQSERDVNQLRASLGNAENQSTLPELHSFNTNRELKDTLAISFNLTSSSEEEGDGIVKYAILRVYREPVELASLNCSNLSDLTLQLYTQTSTKGGNPVFSLRGAQPLSPANFNQGGWVEFLNLTSMYKAMVESDTRLNTRLALSSPTCSGLSPSDLGFVSLESYRAQLVGFEENPLFDAEEFPDIITARLKRDASESSVSIDDLSTDPSPTEAAASTHPTGHPALANPDSYRHQPCRLYSHNITFASLGWDNIISPLSYTANFCAGRCEWSQRSNIQDRHAYIQAQAHFLHPDRFPPPCCVPVPDSYKSLGFVLQLSEGEFAIRNYKEMVATKCACL